MIVQGILHIGHYVQQVYIRLSNTLNNLNFGGGGEIEDILNLYLALFDNLSVYSPKSLNQRFSMTSLGLVRVMRCSKVLKIPRLTPKVVLNYFTFWSSMYLFYEKNNLSLQILFFIVEYLFLTFYQNRLFDCFYAIIK